MAFNIYFKKTTSDPKTAVKVFEGNAIEKTCTPYAELDDLNGYVIIDYTAAILDYNYAEYGGKSYFITDRTRDIGGKMKVFLKVDSLSTYWNQIKECDAVVNTTTDSNGWTAMVQGNRMIYAYGVNHGLTLPTEAWIDFDDAHFYMGIYG